MEYFGKAIAFQAREIAETNYAMSGILI